MYQVITYSSMRRTRRELFRIVIGVWGATLIMPGFAAAVPPACVAVQDSIDNSVPESVHAALQDAVLNPGGACKTQTSDKYPIDDRFALSAGVLAQRALAISKCEQKTFTRRAHCLTCFNRAAAPLLRAFDNRLFHGLIANAASIVLDKRAAKCAGLR